MNIPEKVTGKVSQRISQQLKDALISAGLWRAFQDYRNELKEQGATPKEAREKSVEKYLALLEESGYETTSSPQEVVAYNKANTPDSELPPLSLADFPDVPASEPEIIRWVAKNLEMTKVSPSDCPDPIAWNLLIHLRLSPVAKADFWKSTYPKLLPSRSQIEDGSKSEGYDGKSIVDTIGQIQEIHKAVCGQEAEK